MSTIEIPGEIAVERYMNLYRRTRDLHRPTNGFAYVARQIAEGRYRYLRNHYSQSIMMLKDGTRDVAALIQFKPHSPSRSSALGGILALNSVSAADIHELVGEAVSAFGGREVYFPLNGHIYYGFSAPFPETVPDSITFWTTSSYPPLDHLFTSTNARIDREYFALVAQLDADTRAQLAEEIKVLPAGFSTRPLSIRHFRRDMAIYNSLINETMGELPHFAPMTEREWWDVVRYAMPLMTPSICRFLLYRGREVGYCFSYLDYNRVLGTSSDWRKAIRISLLRRRIDRARIYASGILPQYRGSGLFKYVGNQVLIAMIDSGVTQVERSYIDHDNANSLANARSRGAESSHKFAIFEAV